MRHDFTTSPYAPAVGALLVLVTVWTSEATALRHQPREGWVAGVSWGIGRGGITTAGPASQDLEFREGATPQWRIGPMLGSKFLLALEHRLWFVERASFDPPDTVKGRLTLQSFGLSLDFFPGNPHDATGGIYLRVGAGIGWSGVNFFEGIGLGHGDRTDEAGFSVLVGAGYDFWVSRNFLLGAGIAYHYFDIGGAEYVDKGWFSPVVLNGTLVF